eukprot:TRINITY_DN9317_c0_g1_i1.p1 TRINITY_DN9317_c0_g1~~TRINITY_DN9317_c0_g1_i1.p1  ORF type:complete len:112 (+),score=2.88 TRINITY_DN9317_c0_g1_i1:12-347(+)
MEEWLKEWMDGLMDGRIDGRMDGWTEVTKNHNLPTKAMHCNRESQHSRTGRGIRKLTETWGQKMATELEKPQLMAVTPGHYVQWAVDKHAYEGDKRIEVQQDAHAGDKKGR